MSDKPQQFDHYAAFNAFIDNGWFGHLTPTQAAIWFAYLRHADNVTGIGYVTRQQAMTCLGHRGLSHFREDRKRLCAFELLELAAAATVQGIYSRAAEYRVLIPGVPSESRTRPESGLVRNRSETRPDSARKPVRNRDTPQLLTQPLSQPLIPTIDAEVIYQAYPRKVAKPAALKAIEKATQKIGKRSENNTPEWLLERTKLYATARNAAVSTDPNAAAFTPNPATWFNQERFNDDPDTWAKPVGRKPSGNYAENIKAPVVD